MKSLVLACLVASFAAWAAGAPAHSPATSSAAPATARSGVDWSGQVLAATGTGAPDLRALTSAQARLGAETAAKLDAFRNLLAQAKGLPLTGGKTLGDALSDEVTRGHLEGVLHSFKITHRRYFSDNGVELQVEVPLAGVLAALPAPPQPVAVNEKGRARFTGLIVDARGLKVSPVLAPRLLGPDGKAIYARGALRDSGATVASYARSLKLAKASGRVGAHPLTVKAVKADGADLVLDAAAVARIAAHNSAYLAEGKVAIVADGIAR